MSANQCMSNYITSFVEIVDKLAEVNIELNEELKVIILLSSLPSEYENFVVAIETRDALPTFSALKIKLLEEGTRREQHQSNQESSTQAIFTQIKETSTYAKKGALRENVMVAESAVIPLLSAKEKVSKSLTKKAPK